MFHSVEMKWLQQSRIQTDKHDLHVAVLYISYKFNKPVVAVAAAAAAVAAVCKIWLRDCRPLLRQIKSFSVSLVSWRALWACSLLTAKRMIKQEKRLNKNSCCCVVSRRATRGLCIHYLISSVQIDSSSLSDLLYLHSFFSVPSILSTFFSTYIV